MRRTLTSLLACLLLTGAAVLKAAEPPVFHQLTGEIEDARWTALVPENWEGRLLLEAPDARHAPEPLAPSLDPADPANRELLAAGWTVAAIGARRHGPVVSDSIDDLRTLRDHLAGVLGQPKLTVVEGTGMGGLVAAFIAERHADEFHGCIARDPQLELRDPRALRLKCDHQPRAPLLFLASPATIESVRAYLDRASSAANAESVAPVLWETPGEPPPDDAALRREALSAMEIWVLAHRPPAHRMLPSVPEALAIDSANPSIPPPATAPDKSPDSALPAEKAAP